MRPAPRHGAAPPPYRRRRPIDYQRSGLRQRGDRLRHARRWRRRRAASRRRRAGRSRPASCSAAQPRSIALRPSAGPTSRIIVLGRHRVDGHRLGGRVRLEFLGHHHVGRQQDLAIGRARGLRMARAVSCISASCSDLPMPRPCAARKVFAIAPPITSTSTFFDRLPSRSSLVRDLGAADDGDDRARRIVQRGIERLQLRLHQPAGIGGQQVGHALGAGMGAMGGGEGVVHVDIGQARQRRGEGGVVASPRRRGSGCSPAAATSPSARAGDRRLGDRRRCSPRRRRRARLSAADSASASGRSDISGTRLPLGRSKWLHTTTRAPAFRPVRAMVGHSRSMRVRSVMAPSLTGTLRSARTSTRLPWAARASMVRYVIAPKFLRGE